jgi:hypothetical protein
MANLHHPSILGQKPKAPFDLSKFFEMTLPEILQMRSRWIGDLTYRVGFWISGPEGGAWTIDLKDKTCEKLVDPQSLDAVVCTSQADFELLTEGRLNIADATANGRLSIGGSSDAVLAIASLIAL